MSNLFLKDLIYTFFGKFEIGFLIVLFVSFVSLVARGEVQLVFENLSESIALDENDNHYIDRKYNRALMLSDRLIVKSAKYVTAQEMQGFDNRIKKIWKIYQGADFDFYVVQITSERELFSVMKVILNKPAVMYAQPDILQLRYQTDMLSPLPERDFQKQVSPQEQGEGVTIAVIDDGFDFTHPALRHIRPRFSYDVSDRNVDSRPKKPIDTHGTKVLGVLFARGERVAGLIPMANLIAIRQPDTWTSNTLLAFQLARLAGADVINCSWHSQWLLEPIYDVVVDLAKHGREGKGVAVVFPAGNEHREVFPLETESGILEAIVVGANHRNGHRAGYSNFGAPIDGFFTVGDGVLSTTVNDGYELFSGTSLAAVLVSAQIVRILAQEPTISLNRIEQRIFSAETN